jgi:hypothetical protein
MSGLPRGNIVTNFSHNLFSHRSAVRNPNFDCWTGFFVVRQLAGRKYRRRDQQNSSSSFVHRRTIQIRFVFAQRELCEVTEDRTKWAFLAAAE